MTVQTRVHDGISVKTRTWRNVYKTKGLAEVREGFFAQREHSRWGIMVQLKGKERIELGRFGANVSDVDVYTLYKLTGEQKI